MFYKFGVLLLIGTYLSMTTALPPCVCTRERSPVCASDGQTYSNKCLFECARYSGKRDLEIKKLGPCEYEKPVCVCTLEYSPVCGSNGVSYPNMCALQCEGELVEFAYRGECRTKREEVSVVPLPVLPPCTCTREKIPVCGTDGNTYSNPCLLNCAKESNEDLQIDHDGECSNEVKVVEHAENISCACGRSLEPVCASNGVTFSNPCLLHCAGTHLSVAHYGPCESA